MKDFFTSAVGLVVGILLLIGLVLGTIFIGGTIKRSTADFRGKTNQIEKTRADANYRIASYDSFFDQCAAAQTAQQNLANTKVALKQAKRAGDQSEVLRQETNLQAQSNNLNDLVNQYNADARKADTKAHFLASSLPYTLYTTQEIQCAA